MKIYYGPSPSEDTAQDKSSTPAQVNQLRMQVK